MKVKTSELIGAALNWAVAKCEGLNPNTDPEVRRQYVGYPGFAEANGFGYAIRCYSTDWEQGGPIIERELMDMKAKYNSDSDIVPIGEWYWQASTVGKDGIAWRLDGPTPLIATMRCFVASKLGDVVDVPDTLIV